MDNYRVYASCALRSLAEVGLSARTRDTGHCSNAGWLSAVLPVQVYTIRRSRGGRRSSKWLSCLSLAGVVEPTNGTPHAAHARPGRSRAGQIPFFPGARIPFGSIASFSCSWKRRNA